MRSNVYDKHPEVKFFGTKYRVGFHVQGTSYKESAYADILVREDGLAELEDWYWFGKRKPFDSYKFVTKADKDLYDIRKDVWEWLTEWELVELRQIGREDWEYFATDKLIGGSVTLELEG